MYSSAASLSAWLVRRHSYTCIITLTRCTLEVASLALLRVKLENVHLKVRATCRDMTCRLGLSFLLRSHDHEVPETARASSAGKAEAAGRCDVGVCRRPAQSLEVLVQALPHGGLHQGERVQSCLDLARRRMPSPRPPAVPSGGRTA